MSRSRVKNIAASVRYRLLEMARRSGRPFNERLLHYAIERFLYRLSRSPHSGKFVLKGALMFTAWRGALSCPNMEIDLLGRISNSMDHLVAVVKGVCLQEVEPDGMIFDSESVVAERIVEDADQEGVRVLFRGSLDRARISIQLDIGFGDGVIPSPTVVDYPTFLQMPGPTLHGYSKESVIAEKLEAMGKLDILNSRMKDFHDIWFLSRHFEFDGEGLGAAIQATFTNRGTRITTKPSAFNKFFAGDPSKRAQWQGFIRKSRLETVPGELAKVTSTIAAFLEPVLAALVEEKRDERGWKPPGSWQET